MESFRIHLGSLNQIPLGQCRCFRIGYHEVAILRSCMGELSAFDNSCPKGGRLVEGVINNNQIECTVHEHKFESLSGQTINSQETLRKLKVWEENGNIVLAFVFPVGKMSNIEQ